MAPQVLQGRERASRGPVGSQLQGVSPSGDPAGARVRLVRDPETTNLICANGPFQVWWLTNVSSGIAIWAAQDGVDDADDTDDGDWGRCWR